MNPLFVSHIEKQNQINQSYALHCIIIIIVIIAAALITTIKKTPKSDNTFLSYNTSNSLRGIAIIFLIFGHFAIKCIDGELFFEYAGRWAIIIFLYISGVALAKTYGLTRLDKKFLLKRFKRLAFPTWITLSVFYSLEYVLLNKSYSIKMIVLNFFGIIGPSRPNGAAWFITYIIFLYLLYFMVSRINTNSLFKIICLFFTCYLCTYIIWHNKFLKSYIDIWTYYSFVFPASVLIGLYRKEIKNALPTLHRYPILCFIIITVFSYQYFYEIGIHRFSNLMTSWTYSHIIKTFQPASLIISLIITTLLIDRFAIRSAILNWIGRYSFEIYLVHMPLMVYYDFFLFRKPLYIFFLIYFFVVLILSVLLNRLSSKINLYFFKDKSNWNVKEVVLG